MGRATHYFSVKLGDQKSCKLQTVYKSCMRNCCEGGQGQPEECLVIAEPRNHPPICPVESPKRVVIEYKLEETKDKACKVPANSNRR
jgi:hypothetical protein